VRVTLRLLRLLRAPATAEVSWGADASGRVGGGGGGCGLPRELNARPPLGGVVESDGLGGRGTHPSPPIAHQQPSDRGGTDEVGPAAPCGPASLYIPRNHLIREE
jgi:hypothetical protein